MTLILNGTDNSATTPAVTGTDTDTGVYYPAANQVALATNGALALLVNSAQNVGIGSSNPGAKLTVEGTGNIVRLGDGTNSFNVRFQGPNNWSQELNTSTDVFTLQRNSVDFLGVNSAGGVSLKGASNTANGVGIVFPATQAPSTDANTLDDYEEGSWTPTVNLLGTVTYSQQFGRYIKIGRNVTVQAYMVYSSTDSTQDGTSMTVGGVPFTANSSATGTSCMMTERMYGVNNPTASNIFHVGPLGSSAVFQLYQNNYNGGITNASYFVSQQRSCYKGGNQYIYFSFSYDAAA